MNISNTKDLKEIAKKIRKHIILMTAEAGTAHYMSSLSSVEILVLPYYKELNHYPETEIDEWGRVNG